METVTPVRGIFVIGHYKSYSGEIGFFELRIYQKQCMI